LNRSAPGEKSTKERINPLELEECASIPQQAQRACSTVQYEKAVWEYDESYIRSPNSEILLSAGVNVQGKLRSAEHEKP
jgi:hypothetical protein